MQADHVLLTFSGLRCPMPLLKTKQRLAQIQTGERLLVITTDAGSRRDIPAYLLALSEHTLADMAENDDVGQYQFHCKGARTNTC